MYRKNRLWRDLLRHSRKSLVFAVAMVIALSGAIGGTLAWLIDSTAPIKNTFTVGDINIDLKEDNVDGGSETENSYEMTPGKDITKDPTVTVYAGSKDSWLFVKIDKSSNFEQYLTYEVASGWTELSAAEGVYYREVDRDNVNNQIFTVLKDNKVSVLGSVTKEMLSALAQSGNYPTMTLTAYAVQRDATIDAIDTAEEAWAIAAAQAPATAAAAEESVQSADDASAQLTPEEQAWINFASLTPVA